MRMMHRLLAGTRLAVKGHEHHTRDIEGGHERRDGTEHPGIATNRRPRRPGRVEDRVLRVISREEGYGG